jgi:hypothetical protein
VCHGIARTYLADEFFIALDIGQQDAGFEVVGPAPSIANALNLVSEPGCDVALLDVNSAGETSEPVARKLRESDKPFVVLRTTTPTGRRFTRGSDAGAFGGLTRNRLQCMQPAARPIVPALCRGNHTRAGTRCPGLKRQRTGRQAEAALGLGCLLRRGQGTMGRPGRGQRRRRGDPGRRRHLRRRRPETDRPLIGQPGGCAAMAYRGLPLAAPIG